MSKELWAILGSAVVVLATIITASMRIGALVNEVDHQRAEIAALSAKIDALTVDFNGTRLETMRILLNNPAR